ncbi:MAG: GNAT family N-acetyltransferase [Clostridia bacterium]
MFKAIWSLGLNKFEYARAVREAVFVQERGIAEQEEFDWFDGIAAHLYVSDEADTPIAAGRLYPDGELTRLDRIAVMPDFRGLPYDDLVLRTMLYKAQQLGGDVIATQVLADEVAMYLPFGFTQTATKLMRGGEYAELTVMRDCVKWDSACKHDNK